MSAGTAQLTVSGDVLAADRVVVRVDTIITTICRVNIEYINLMRIATYGKVSNNK